MAYGVITPMDANIVIDKQRTIDILSDSIINKYVSPADPNKIQLWSNSVNTNNTEIVSFTKEFTKSVLLAPKDNGERPIIPEKITSTGNANFLSNLHNIYISTFDVRTLYANAWSNTIEIYVMYGGKEIILSSTLLSLQQFKLSKFDLNFANRYYSNYCPVQVLDLKSMVLSGNPEQVELVAKLIEVPANQILDSLFSPIQYRFGYIDSDTIQTPPDVEFFSFEVEPILSRPENPASWSLEGDLNIQIKVVNNTVVVGLDQSNPELMNILRQISGSTELLDIQYNLTFTSYKTSVDNITFETDGVNYTEISKYAITCSNTFEPAEAITIIPAISQDADLVVVNVLMQITSSNNTISLSKQVQQLIKDNDLNQLKRVIYNINTELVKVNNVIETTQKVIQFNDTNSMNNIQARSQLQFVNLKSVYVNDLENATQTDDSTAFSLGLRTMPMVFAVRFVTDSDIDLRKYENINILYAGKSSKPVKVEKDVLYMQLSWQNYDEIGIEINGIVATVIGAERA